MVPDDHGGTPMCAILAGVSTISKNEGQSLVFSCMINFWLNVAYIIIYA